MSSIFDDDPIDPNSPPVQGKSEDKKRSKHRETLNSSDMTTGRRKLAEMVTEAFNTLQNATREADYPTAIKAAQIILDRAGFGPKSTVDVNTTHVDLSELTREELAERASRISAQLRGKIDLNPDVKPVTIN
jgi:hypothetical protein